MWLLIAIPWFYSFSTLKSQRYLHYCNVRKCLNCTIFHGEEVQYLGLFVVDMDTCNHTIPL